MQIRSVGIDLGKTTFHHLSNPTFLASDARAQKSRIRSLPTRTSRDRSGQCFLEARILEADAR